MKIIKLISKLALIVAMTAFGFAQGRGYGQGPRYDSAAETTLAGTVDEVQTLDSMCHSGTHILVKTDKGNVEVALGPTQFLTDQKFELKKGDPVQVVGARMSTRHGEMFVARQITGAGKSLTLRDAQGVPAWPQGMCR